MSRAILAFGSNLGDRVGNLNAALHELDARGVRLLRGSSIWESAPVPSDQPLFLNCTVAVETVRTPDGLLGAAKEVEAALGRRPGRRWGPRPIDVDLLFFEDLRIETPTLTIPHPRLQERGFVLAPLSEVERGPLPGLPQGAAARLLEVGMAGLRRTGRCLVLPERF